MRREHVVTLIVLAWSSSASASDEDIAIERATNDLKCDDLAMMHAKNEYAFVGCGRRRVYECTNAKCEDVTNRKVPAKDAACPALVSAAVGVGIGCACITIIGASKGSVPTLPSPPVVAPDVCAAN